ncbi:MAG: peptidoglycan-associated lipoprotein Pal [Burkholderiales bacterium]
MRIPASFAVLAIAAGLAGCATTESPESATSAAPQSTGSQSTTGAQTGTRGKDQIASTSTGTAPGGSQGPELKRSVYFEFDKYDVKAEYRALVESNARWLRENPKARLTIEGNADERGSREYNVALGQRRAEAVSKLLVLMGARPEQIEAVSWGEEKPRGTGHDETSWAENRRSDFAQR